MYILSFPKNVNLRAFLSNRRESLVCAFRKKTPLSVRRRGGGGAKGATESVHRNLTFFIDGFPKQENTISIKVDLNGKETPQTNSVPQNVLFHI